MTDWRSILVIANETVDGAVLHEAIRYRARNVLESVPRHFLTPPAT